MRRHRADILRLVAHVGSWLPAVWLARAYLSGDLTANPIQAAEQYTGRFALTLLVLSLACSPLSTWLGWRGLIKVRRALGLYAVLYAILHVYILVGVDYGFAFDLLWGDLANKPYILAGAATLLLLLPLAVTSFKWWMRRLGKNWKRLHRLVYLAAPVAVLHYAWAQKGDLFGLRGTILLPLAYGAVVALLLLARLPAVRRLRQRTGAKVRVTASQVRKPVPPS